METLRDLANFALQPLVAVFTDASDRSYWAYLVFTLVLALAATLLSGRRRSISQALAYCLPKAIYWHPSARADYQLWLLNNLFFVAVLPTIVFAEDLTRGATRALLAGILGVSNLGLGAGTGARVVFTLADVIAIDAGLFLAHYLQHRVPLLWEFHKTHHSAEVLTPITVFRMHPVDIWVNFLIVGVCLGVNVGVFGFIFAEPPRIFAVNGINLVIFAFLLLGYHLRHSHIWLMYPPIIARHISSPALHLIHHSRDPRHWDKNLGRIFNIWDRLAGTLYLPSAEEAVVFGLADDEHLKFRGLAALYGRPLENVIARWRGGGAGAVESAALDGAESAKK